MKTRRNTQMILKTKVEPSAQHVFFFVHTAVFLLPKNTSPVV